MEHVVFYPGADGVPSFQRVSSLEAAVNYVEHLRNAANITEFSVHALTQVPVSLRAYYHVEVPAEAVAEAPAEAPAEVVAAAVETPVVDALTLEHEPVAAPAVEEPAVEEPAIVADFEQPAVVDEPSEPIAMAELADAARAAMDATETAPLDVAPQEIAESAVEEPAVDAPAATPEPVADEDRSEEWVAEATVAEPAFEVPAVAPSLAPQVRPSVFAPPISIPVPAIEPDAEPAEAAAGEFSAATSMTPFGEAPPVLSEVPAEQDEVTASTDGAELAAELPPLEPATADVVPMVPAGRRSMGFFAR